jgi:hypothetical protein
MSDDDRPMNGRLRFQSSGQKNAFEAKLDALKARWATGFSKTNGRHVARDGLVSARGYRRIVHDAGWVDDWDVDALEDLALSVLHGRNATIFEAHMLGPLRGKPKRSVESLAKQFGVGTKRIYKILGECRRRLEAERDKRAAARLAAGAANFEMCGLCQREVSLAHRPSICGRCIGHYGSTRPKGELNSDCLIAQRQARAVGRRFPSPDDISKAETEWRKLKAAREAEGRARLDSSHARSIARIRANSAECKEIIRRQTKYF